MNFVLLLTFRLTLLSPYFGKSCKTTLFRKPIEVSQNASTFVLIGPPIMKKRPFKNMKKLCFFWRLLFQNKNCWHFEWINYLGKGLSYLKKWGIGINYCWNYRPLTLLLHFIEYRLSQLNNKHMIALQKSDLPITNLVWIKVWFTSNGNAIS